MNQYIDKYLDNKDTFLSLYSKESRYASQRPILSFDTIKEECISDIYTLLETISQLKENNEKLKKFKEISVNSLEAPIFQKLIFAIIRNFNKYRSLPSVYHLLKHRLE